MNEIEAPQFLRCNRSSASPAAKFFSDFSLRSSRLPRRSVLAKEGLCGILRLSSFNIFNLFNSFNFGCGFAALRSLRSFAADCIRNCSEGPLGLVPIPNSEVCRFAQE